MGRLCLSLFTILALASPSFAEVFRDLEPPENVGYSLPRDSDHPLSRVESARFAAGTWNFHGYGSAALGKSARKVYAGHVALGYHLLDNFSVNLEGVGYFIDQTHDTAALGLNLLPRWHYWHRQNWSLFLDGGAGIIYSHKTLRDPGTHLNFTLQGGLGATYDLTDSFVPISGVRWFHISNAHIRGKERNVGFDSPMFYLGLMVPF